MKAHTIQLSLPEHLNEILGGKEVTFFVIKVKCDGQQWELKRRYNEFAELKKELALNHGGLPSMPGKTLFKIRKDDFLEKRRSGLESFLKKLMDRQDIFGNEQFLDFLKVSFFLFLTQKK